MWGLLIHFVFGFGSFFPAGYFCFKLYGGGAYGDVEGVLLAALKVVCGGRTLTNEDICQGAEALELFLTNSVFYVNAGLGVFTEGSGGSGRSRNGLRDDELLST